MTSSNKRSVIASLVLAALLVSISGTVSAGNIPARTVTQIFQYTSYALIRLTPAFTDTEGCAHQGEALFG